MSTHAAKRTSFSFSLKAHFVITALAACVLALELKIREAQQALRERQRVDQRGILLIPNKPQWVDARP